MRTFTPRRRRRRAFLRLRRNRDGPRGFTLIELLVTLAVLLLVLATLLSFVTNVEQAWRSTSTDPFAEAENALGRMADHLANATLEPYQDYANSQGLFRTGTGSFTPDHLTRRSDLAFVCGPSAGSTGWLAGSGRVTESQCLFFVSPAGYTQTESHQGLERLLNACGYFVEFSDDDTKPAFILTTTHRWRWRLKEVEQPAEALTVYTQSLSSLPWVQTAVQANAPVSILAENVIALLALPERAANDAALPQAIAPAFLYDSRDSTDPLTRHQLPARVLLVLVAIDEASAQILAAQNGVQPPMELAGNLFTSSTQLTTDLATLDATLTSRKINHRILQREIALSSSAWSNTLSQ